MKTFTRALSVATVALLFLGLLLAGAVPSEARGGRGGGGRGHSGGHWGGDGHHHHHRHFHHVPRGGVVVVGPWWWGPAYPYWWDYPYYVYSPPPVIVQQAPVYIEQSMPGYWYYCPSAKGYYPAVPACPEPWIRVVPRTPRPSFPGSPTSWAKTVS